MFTTPEFLDSVALLRVSKIEIFETVWCKWRTTA